MQFATLFTAFLSAASCVAAARPPYPQYKAPTPERITELFSVLGTTAAPSFFNTTVSPDVKWTIMGSGAKVGTKTRDEIVAAIRLLGPKFRTRNFLEVKAVTGGGYLEWAAVELASKPNVTLIDGSLYNMTMVFMTRWQGEKIIELREYLDTALISRVENLQV